MWGLLQSDCFAVSLSPKDALIWKLTNSRVFYIYSMYLGLKVCQVKLPHRKLWFVRVPFKLFTKC
jgi:hypothetical protein